MALLNFLHNFESFPGFLALFVLIATLHIIYRSFFHRHSHIPGPLLNRITSLPLHYHIYFGTEATYLSSLHAKYGPVILAAPNEVSLLLGETLHSIYISKGGFLKTPCYSKFDFDGHITIFSAIQPAYRSVRAKAVVGLFSTAAIRDNGMDGLRENVERFVKKLEGEKKSGRVDVLDMGRRFSVDAMTNYLFGKSYGGLFEKDKQGTKDSEEDQLTVSAFVDSLVAVGRCFLMPGWAAMVLEKAARWYSPALTTKTDKSAELLESFLEQLVKEADVEDETYQGKLKRAGITDAEIVVQCKDLIFAGTDTSGMNVATICLKLCQNPAILARLRAELAAHDQDQPPESLPYLQGVVRESLRLSQALPTRLPRVVPPGGFSITIPTSTENPVAKTKAMTIPAGTSVGLPVGLLHTNPAIYPNPEEFAPERWLDASEEMQRDFIPFGLGPRACIARNFAMAELYAIAAAVAKSDFLDGAKAEQETVEIYEWFNSRVKGDRGIGLVWN